MPAGERLTILLVEKPSRARTSLADAFKRVGLTVVEVGNADAAIAALTGNGDIGIVVAELQISSGMDEINLSEWMRERTSKTPLVLTSDHPIPSEVGALNPAIAITVRTPCPPNEIVGWVSSLIGWDGVIRG